MNEQRNVIAVAQPLSAAKKAASFDSPTSILVRAYYCDASSREELSTAYVFSSFFPPFSFLFFSPLFSLLFLYHKPSRPLFVIIKVLLLIRQLRLFVFREFFHIWVGSSPSLSFFVDFLLLFYSFNTKSVSKGLCCKEDLQMLKSSHSSCTFKLTCFVSVLPIL